MGKESSHMRSMFLSTLLSAVLFASTASVAGEWYGLTEDAWCSGPKLTPEKLKGKVVLVDKWGVFCPPCRRSLPHIESIWRKFRSKPFVVIGAHCQGNERQKIAELVNENKLTYSIYLTAGRDDEPQIRGIPAYYIVSPSGKIVYNGIGFSPAMAKELEDAVSDALAKAPSPDSLCGGVEAEHFKADAAKLVAGKNVEAVLSKLKSAAAKEGPAAEEAKALISAVESANSSLKAEIRSNAKTRPGLAYIQLETLVKTWPSEKTQCAKAIRKLSASADVRAVVKLRRTLESIDATTPRNELEKKKLSESRKSAIAAAAAFAKSEFPGVASEIAELTASAQ